MGVPPEPLLSSLLLAQTAVRRNPSTVVGRQVETGPRGGIFAELPVRLLLPVAFICLAVVLWACLRILRIVLVDRHRRGGDGGAEERLVEAMSGKVVSLAEERMRRRAAELAAEDGENSREPSELDDV